MKKLSVLLIFSILVITPPALAVPLNLIDAGFVYDDPFVNISGNEIVFSETFDMAPIWAYNDNFFVEEDVTILTFNYDFQLGELDYDDYLTFEFNYESLPATLEVNQDITQGYFAIDLTSYRGNEVSLFWGLYWGGDMDADTTARIYNIDLARESSTPVPEPATIILFGTGLAGLAGIGRKKIFKNPSSF